jgi:predicted deacetylase
LVARAVLNLPTTEGLIDRLKAADALLRICGFDCRRKIPGAWQFSRAFAEFAAGQLPARVHEALS